MLPVFGPGAIFLQRTDIANATPVNIGRANEFQIDQQFTKKELYGQSQFPLLVARGTAKLTAKATAAVVSGMALNSAFFGMTLEAGQQATALSESGTVASGAYTVAQHASFVADLGVVYAATGLPLVQVASAPAAGQYAQSGGVYSFNAADNGKGVFVTYTYAVAGTGQQLTLANTPLGTTPTFQLWYYTSTNGVPLNIQLFACVADKLSLAFKLEDFMLPELSFSCFADAAGNVGVWSFGEAS